MGFLVTDALPRLVVVPVGEVVRRNSEDEFPAAGVAVVASWGTSAGAARARRASGVRKGKGFVGVGSKVTARGEEGTVAWAIVGPPFVNRQLIRALHQTKKQAQTRVDAQARRAVMTCLKAARSAAAHPTTDKGWAISDLRTLGGKESSASAINEQGDVVGSSTAQNSYDMHAFLWQDGRMRDVGLHPAGFNWATDLAINDHDQIVGVSEKIPDSLSDPVVPPRAWFWQDGVTTELGEAVGLKINEHGQVIGNTAEGSSRGSFLWQNGTRIDLPLDQAIAINNQGQIIGLAHMSANAPDVAVVWQQGQMHTLDAPGLSSITPVAINDEGQIIAHGTTSKSHTRSLLWENGTVTDLGTLGGTDTIANAINNQGEIVGSSAIKGTSRQHAFLWQAGQLHDLGTLGGPASIATAINDQGQIVGSGNTKWGSHEFVWESGKMKELAGLGGVEQTAHAINNRGQIVGESETPNRDQHAVLWAASRTPVLIRRRHGVDD